MVNYKRYVLLVLAAVGIAWLALTVAGTATYYLYPRTVLRAANVRDVPVPFRLGLMMDFIETRLAISRDPVIIMGDSQFYGAGQNWRDTFPTFMVHDLGRDVFNASIVDGRFDDIRLLLSHMHIGPSSTIIYNVNLSHFSTDEPPAFQRLGSWRSPAPLFLANPSTAWVFMRELIKPTTSQDFQYVGLEKTRYDIDRNAGHIEKFRSVLRALEASGARAIVVMAPQQMGAMDHYHFDIRQIQSDTAFLYTICLEYKVTCLDLSEALPPDSFRDIIHLGTTGHRRMSLILADAVRNAK